MTLNRSLTDGEPTWVELQDLVESAGTRPSSLGSTRLLRLGTLYRGGGRRSRPGPEAFSRRPCWFSASKRW